MIGARGGSTVPTPAASGRAEMPWHGALAAKTLRMTSMKALWMTSSREPSWLSGRPAKQNCGAMCSVRTHGGSGLNCSQRARGKRKKLRSRPARAPTKSAVSASALALMAVSHFAILRSIRGPSRSGEVPRTGSTKLTVGRMRTSTPRFWIVSSSIFLLAASSCAVGSALSGTAASPGRRGRNVVSVF